MFSPLSAILSHLDSHSSILPLIMASKDSRLCSCLARTLLDRGPSSLKTSELKRRNVTNAPRNRSPGVAIVSLHHASIDSTNSLRSIIQGLPVCRLMLRCVNDCVSPPCGPADALGVLESSYLRSYTNRTNQVLSMFLAWRRSRSEDEGGWW